MYADRYLVKSSHDLRLDNYDPNDTGTFKSKSEVKQKLQADCETLADLQDKLFAQARNGVLIVLQGMDTAGKDGVVEHVMSGLNPSGVFVQSFRQPSSEEQRHDYLWRANKALPARGHIGIFNRSYYEDVIVTRVHPALLGEFEQQANEQGTEFWKTRFSDIAAFERYLADNNIVVLKFFLHISKDEQKKRLLQRLDNPSKQWKFSVTDLQERSFWDEYIRAYEDMLSHTSEANAPWYVIPANHKWFARVAIADIIAGHLEKLRPEDPQPSPLMQEQLAKAKAAIDAEGA
jgi:PPK2 family polyphosphate:nucleotide phosphotransferase